MKKILKVIYVLVCVIICIFAYLLAFSTFSYDYIKGITNTSIANEDYANVAKIHGGMFESVNIVNNETSDNFDMVVFPSGTLSTFNYTENDAITTEYLYEESYYVYLFNIKLGEDYTKNGILTNETSFIFRNNEGGEARYYFTVSEKYNSTEYKETVTSKEDAMLHASHDLFEYYNNYGFINFTLTKSLVASLSSNSTLNNKIDSITVVNSLSEEVGTVNVDLNYTQQFFTDIAPLVSSYNTYIDVANSDASDDEKTQASNTFDTFYEGFETSFLTHENYTFRYENEYLQPTSVVWQAIGVVVVFIICLILIYFLIFHFKYIKGIFNKNSQKYDRYSSTTGNKTIITAKTKTVNNKPQTKNEEVNNEETSKDTQEENK